MDIIKSEGFFDPDIIGNNKIHIIGCGSVGSTLAELFARFGIKKLYLYDFDTVCDHNIVNQMFFANQIGKKKTDSVEEIVKNINPDIEIVKYDEGYTDQKLSGYVFLAVDSIELRHKICVENKRNPDIKAIFDFRTRLTDAQHFAANWHEIRDVNSLIKLTDFTDEEADKETPTSACGVTLGVAPTVRMICNVGVANFINFVKGENIKHLITIDAFSFNITAV